jgi:hypothetical protein
MQWCFFSNLSGSIRPGWLGCVQVGIIAHHFCFYPADEYQFRAILFRAVFQQQAIQCTAIILLAIGYFSHRYLLFTIHIVSLVNHLIPQPPARFTLFVLLTPLCLLFAQFYAAVCLAIPTSYHLITPPCEELFLQVKRYYQKYQVDKRNYDGTQSESQNRPLDALYPIYIALETCDVLANCDKRSGFGGTNILYLPDTFILPLIMHFYFFHN